MAHHIPPCWASGTHFPLSSICCQCTYRIRLYTRVCVCIFLTPSLHSAPAELSLF